MSLTRKMLKAMGIEEEKIEQIIEAHTETVDALKAHKEDADKLKDVQNELDDLKAAGDGGYKEKYETEHKAFEDYKNEVETQKLNRTKEQAFRSVLKELGIADKRIDSIVRVTKFEDMELDGDKLKDVETLKTNLQTEWAEFIPATQTTGVKTANPPANNPTKTYTRDEIRKMTPAEINQNWESIKGSLKGE